MALAVASSVTKPLMMRDFSAAAIAGNLRCARSNANRRPVQTRRHPHPAGAAVGADIKVTARRIIDPARNFADRTGGLHLVQFGARDKAVGQQRRIVRHLADADKDHIGRARPVRTTFCTGARA